MKQWQFRKPLIYLLVVLILVLVAACGGDTTQSEPTAEPPTASAPTEAAAESESATTEEAANEDKATEEDTAEEETASEEASESADSESTETEAASESASTTEQAASVASNPRTFVIDPAQSEARFLIDEVLRGNPVTVVGVTSQVSGELTIDPADPASASVSTISVDANSLETPEGMRNRSIRNFILQTGSYPTITFAPTSIEGLPASVQVGDSFSFTIVGDLQIRDVVKSVAFNVDVTADTEDQISGLATSTITLVDYNLTIPSVPFVASVGDNVILELQFVAVAQ